MERTPKGFVLIEVLLASFLFLIFAVALGGVLLYGQESTVLAGHRSRAVFLADEGIEAVRNIRDEDFAALVDGTYGLAIADGEWTFFGSSDVMNEYTRTIVVADVELGIKRVTATVSWRQNAERTGEVRVVTYLSGWTVPPPPPPEPPLIP